MDFTEIIPYVREIKIEEARIAYKKKFSLDTLLIYVHEGSVGIEIGNHNHIMKRGSVAVIQCGGIHSIKTAAASLVSYVHFDYTNEYRKTKSFPLPMMDAESFSPKKLISPPSFTDVVVLNEDIFLDNMNMLEYDFYRMHSSFSERHELYVSKLSCILKSILADIAQKSNSHRADSAQYPTEGITELVLDYINRNYAEEVSSKSLSRIFKYNPNYLNSLVKKKTGYSICRYVMVCRISRAMFFLDTSDMSISDIAMKSGFDDLSSFSRTFKKIVGASPANYREIRGGGQHK